VSESTGKPVIELKDIKVYHHARGGGLFRPNIVKAVDGVDFTISRGETVGIVGESGCGKSTLASVLVGLQAPTSGEVLFHGKPAIKRNAAMRKEFGRSVSVVFQDPATALNPRMTVQDILTDPLQIHGIGNAASRAAKVKELLALVGLPQSAAEVTPSQVSGGQRQRVAIARALALDPDIIVADEPTSALDVSVRAQVLNLLSDLKTQLNLGMVFISHDIQTVRYVSDRICVMYFGKIVEQGTATQVFDSPTNDYTKKLLGAAPSLLHI
jgi:peptide/nickel transport system ATP-binding protein